MIRVGWKCGATLAVVLLLSSSGIGGSAPFSLKITPPLGGSYSVSKLNAAWGSAGVGNLSYAFSFLNGTGDLSGSSWANSSATTRNPYGSSPYNSSVGENSISLNIFIQIPFRTHMGTRALSVVNVTLALNLSGVITFTPGNCPWVRATHHKNVCQSSVSARGGVSPQTMTYLKGYGPVTQGVCAFSSNGCSGNGADYGIGANRQVTNTSTGQTATQSGTNGTSTFAASIMSSMTFTPATPITTNHTLVLWLVANAGMSAGFESLAGYGGLSGGLASASLNLSFNVVSIVES